MNTILLLICAVCFVTIHIRHIVKARKYYKKYCRELFEWNQGRGYLQTWNNSRDKFHNHLAASIISAVVVIALYIIILYGKHE